MTEQQQQLYVKSAHVATMVDLMKLPLANIDMEHVQFVINGLRDQVEFEANMAIFNPGRDPQLTELLHLQTDALQALYNFNEALKKCTELKEKIKGRMAHQKDINKLFM